MNSFKRVRAFQIELEFGSVWFLRRGENRSTQRKTSRNKGENQQQTQPTDGQDLKPGHTAPALLLKFLAGTVERFDRPGVHTIPV